MNMNDRALTISDHDERLLKLLADRMSDPVYADYEVVDAEESGIDLRAIWSAIYRNRILIAGVIAFAFAAGVASILLTTPTYRAEATVQIDQQAAKVLSTEDTDPVASGQEADRFLQTQVDIIKSRALEGKVAESLKLANNPDFLKAMGARPPSEPIDPKVEHEQVLSLLGNNLTVDLPRNSRIVGISFDSRDPNRAAAVANSFADNFITSNLQRRFDTSSYSRDFLQRQLASTKAKLEESERALIDYARSAGLIDASAGSTTSADQAGPRSLTTSNLVQLNQAYSQARSTRVSAQQRYEQARSTPLMSLPEVLGNPAVQDLTQKRAEAKAVYQQERQRRKVDHPAIQQAAASIAELDRQIAALAASIRNSIRDQYEVAARQERALAGNVGQLKGETLAEQDRSVRYNILKREVDTNRELYDGLLQRFKEVGAQAGITNNNIAVIDRADPPLRPVSPRPLVNMALALLAGMALALLLVFGREKFDDAIRAPGDVDDKLKLPLLGVVPLLGKSESVPAALGSPRSSFSEAYQSVRSSIELAPAGVPQTLLLTSSRPGEGKSTTAYALALDLAAAGQRVLLIDADMRNPSLHRAVGLANKSGLSNLLARQGAPADVVQHSFLPGLDFLGSGPLPPSPAQLLASVALSDLLAALSEDYDVLIIDGPPVLGLADAPRLAAAVDGVVFVIEANGAHRGHAKTALKRLSTSRAKIIGAVLTKFSAKYSGYGDDYGYSYRYGAEPTPQLSEG